MDSKMKRFHLEHGKNISIDESRTIATRSSSFADAIVFSSQPLLPNEQIKHCCQLRHGQDFSIDESRKNISIDEIRTIATRSSSFADTIVFSSQPLLPNEQFVVQILQTERGWSGHLRIGLTQIDPSTISLLELTMIFSYIYAVPNCGRTWKDIMKDIGEESCNPRGRTWICDLSKHYNASNMVSNLTESTLPTEVGVRFVPYSAHTAKMKISVNGRDLGYNAAETPHTSLIPYQDGPIFAVFDVYGTTKAIGVGQISYFPNLQDLCRQAILQSIQSYSVLLLPLPKPLMLYLLNGRGNIGL